MQLVLVSSLLGSGPNFEDGSCGFVNRPPFFTNVMGKITKADLLVAKEEGLAKILEGCNNAEKMRPFGCSIQ